jgi:hypothetical protein
LQIRVAGQDLSFDFRDLAVATGNSCMKHCPLALNVIERAPVFELRGFATAGLPPHQSLINVTWIDVNAEANSPGLLRGNQSRSTSEKAIVNGLALLGVILNRPSHQFHRLLRAVPRGFFIIAAAERI